MIYDDVCTSIESDKFICIRHFIGRPVRNITVFIEQMKVRPFYCFQIILLLRGCKMIITYFNNIMCLFQNLKTKVKELEEEKQEMLTAYNAVQTSQELAASKLQVQIKQTKP